MLTGDIDIATKWNWYRAIPIERTGLGEEANEREGIGKSVAVLWLCCPEDLVRRLVDKTEHNKFGAGCRGTQIQGKKRNWLFDGEM